MGLVIRYLSTCIQSFKPVTKFTDAMQSISISSKGNQVRPDLEYGSVPSLRQPSFKSTIQQECMSKSGPVSFEVSQIGTESLLKV